MLSYVLIFMLLCYNGAFSVVHGKHVIVNGSIEKVQLTNESVKEEQTKRVNPPPIVEVIHGKVNSVIHEIRGSIDDIPTLLSDAKQKDELLSPTHLKHNTVPYELTESENGGSTGVETVLEEVLHTRAASDLIENTTSSILVGRSGALPEPPSISLEDTKPVPPAPVNGTKDDQPHDDIPSFSEWAKKQMAEAEKNKGENLTVGTVKVRLKNYASPDCGAKVVASNPEALSPGAILSPSRDDYMLNACNVKIWFVVELCEAIQPQRIEIANFELYSSSPKELSIWVSDRFPTREWSLVSSISAKDERTVQSFPLPQLSHFAKYVKVELHSHYGTEHYCPISLFKAFGTSELEVLDNVDSDVDEADESEHTTINEPYDEDEDAIGQADHLVRVVTTGSTVVNNNDPNTEGSVKPGGSGNLLGTAKAAVLSIVKKAAEVLVKSEQKNGTCDGENLTESSNGVHQLEHCVTPAYLIVCTNCTDDFYNRVYEYLSCSGLNLQTILSNSFIRRMLSQSRLCSEIGLNWGLIVPTPLPSVHKGKVTVKERPSVAVDYLRAFLYPETTAALCNYLAIIERKVSLNSSQNILYSESPTPELTILPVTEEPTILTTGTSESSHSHSTAAIPDETIVNVISPTKTVPLVKEEKSIEINDTMRSVDQQEHQEENTTYSEKTQEEVPLITSSLPAATTMPTASSTPHSSPVTTAREEPTSTNGTEKLDTLVPTAPAPPAVPLTVQDEVDPLTLASLFPELEEEGATEPATTKTTTSQTPSTQKESVFVRLANRIKALEVNMSLSGQYLEELSRRYKKQVEELQRTLSNMVEERRLASERESLQAAQISSLTVKVDALTLALSELVSEREKASMIGQHGVIIVVEVVVFLIVLALCRWLGAAKGNNSPGSADRRITSSQPQQLRRHSMDNVDGPTAPKLRRPSEEACLPAGTTHKELLVDGVKRKTSREAARRRKRRRKERWDDEGIVVIGADGEETTSWQPPVLDYSVRTALWTRSKRTSHTQTSSSQETLCSIVTQNNNNSSTATNTTTSSSTTAAGKSKKTGGAIKKIVKKFF